MQVKHEVLVGNTPAAKFWAKTPATIILHKAGERIVFDEMPIYVGQSVVDTKRPDIPGWVETITVSPKTDVPGICCVFSGGLKYALPPSEVGIPVVGFEELEKRSDDFFDGLRIGDAIDGEVYENLYNMLPLLVDKPNYFQLSGVIGTAVNESGKSVAVYLTVKKYGSELSPWRYVGHCAKDDDVHLSSEQARTA